MKPEIVGILAIWPIADKEFFGYLRLLPSFSVSEEPSLWIRIPFGK